MSENNSNIKKLYAARDRFEEKFRDVFIAFQFVDKESIRIRMTFNKNSKVCIIDRYISYVELDYSASYYIDYLFSDMRNQILRSIYGY